jgi:hypothetical protein
MDSFGTLAGSDRVHQTVRDGLRFMLGPDHGAI